MKNTQQYIYASNLQQNLGYPLRTPCPNSGLNEPYSNEGFQIGDVGHVDQYGEFNLLFNIKFPSREFPDLPLLDATDGLNFDQPAPRRGCAHGTVFMSGVKQCPGEARTNQGYKFIATSNTGAILILPRGATLYELDDENSDGIQKLATKYAVQWCKITRRHSLYLLTAVYKTRCWTLGSFSDGFRDGEIYVDQQSCADVFKWECAFTVNHEQAPTKNLDLNQTVFIKGFRMTVRQDLLLAIERLERPERWFSRLLSKVQLKTRKWLSAPRIEYVPTLNFSQPSHPLDIVNHFLLDKNPGSLKAVTHDNDWIEMLKNGLLPTNLMNEGYLRDFMQRKYTWGIDPIHDTIFLQLKNSEGSTVYEHLPTPEYAEETECKLDGDLNVPSDNNSQLVITYMRLEEFDVEHIDAGVCVFVQFGTTTRRTMNKPCADVIEWDIEIILPPDHPVHVIVCSAFQLGSTLGTREISAKQTIDTSDLSRSTYTKKFVFGDPESRASLLITLERHFSCSKTHSSCDEKSDFFDEETNLAFAAFFSHHKERQKEYLETALRRFRCALEQYCGSDPARHAIAHFNLATSEFIRCQANGTYSQLTTAITLYREALWLRGDGDQDRPVTLLLLAQALLSHHAPEYDESVSHEIKGLLADVRHDNSRYRQTAEAITATCRFYEIIDSRNLAEVDGLLRDLERGTYTPLYGYFDRPRLMHKLGTAFWTRFQSSANLDDLERSIELNAEALQLVPRGHGDYPNMVNCLGNSLLCALEARGELMDLAMSVSLKELGESIVKTLDGMLSDGVAPRKLREQIKLMSAANDALETIIEQDPSSCLPAVQSLIADWSREEGTPIKCRRQLAVLLSFLGGEGESKMHEAQEGLGFLWPFKDHKITGTVRVLQGYMPYFFSGVANRLR